MSFREIFDQADRLSGTFCHASKGGALRQEDTSQIDNTAELQREQRGGKPASEAQDQEITELRKTMHKRFVPSIETYGIHANRIVLKRDENRESELPQHGNKSEYDISMKLCSIPEVDWESEVKAIMINSDEIGSEGCSEKKSNSSPGVVGFTPTQSASGSGSHSQAFLRLRRSLPLHSAGLDKIDPYSIFEVDTVTRKEVEGVCDDLDMIIPNREDMYLYHEEAKEEERDEDLDGEHSIDHRNIAATYSRQNIHILGDTPSSGDGFNTNAAITSRSLSGGSTQAATNENGAMAVDDEQELLSSMSLAERKAYNAEKKKERLASTSLTGLANSSFELNNGGIDYSSKADDTKQRARGTVMALNHSKIGVNKLNTWPDLGSTKLKYFHRPRLPKAVTKKKTWKVTFKNSAVIAQNLRNIRRVGEGSLNLSSWSSRVGDNPQDLGLAGGDAVLLEYIEEHPPIRLNYGMASRVINYYRAPDTRNEDDVEEEEDDRRERQSGIRLMREKIYMDYHIPRHVKKLLEHRDSRKDYDHDANIPSLPLGETTVLNPDDKSPFLGEIPEGEILATLSNHLYRAPLFEQTRKVTDYLLVCVKAMHNAMHFIVRPLPRLMVVGQIEPLQVCMRPERDPKMPLSNRVSVVQQAFLRLSVARLFADESHHSTLNSGIEYPAIEKSVLGDYTLDRYWSPQRQKLRETLHSIVHELADEFIDRQTGVRRYKPRAFYKEEYDEELKMTGIEKEIHFSPEELSKRSELTPEAVCLEESSASAEFRLRELGIIEALPLPELWRWLQLMGRVRAARENKAAHYLYFSREHEKKVRALKRKMDSEHAKQGTNTRLLEQIQREMNSFETRARNCVSLSRKMIEEIKVLDEKVEVGRFIFDRLLRAPWNTTAAFVHSHLQGDGLGRMDLSGPGDPSGCEEGFAFVRIVQQEVGSGGSKKGGPKIYNTHADLRKLTNDEAIKLLVAYGQNVSEMNRIRRWDRVALIRSLATKAMMQGFTKGDERFARLGSVKLGGTSKEASYSQKCQEIWDRQCKALTCQLDALLKEAGLSSDPSRGVEEVVRSAEVEETTARESEDAEANQADFADMDNDEDDDSDLEIALDDYVEGCVEERAKEIEKEMMEKASSQMAEEQERERRRVEEQRELSQFWDRKGGPTGASNTIASSSTASMAPASSAASRIQNSSSPVITVTAAPSQVNFSATASKDVTDTVSPYVPAGSPRADVPITVLPGDNTPGHAGSLGSSGTGAGAAMLSSQNHSSPDPIASSNANAAPGVAPVRIYQAPESVVRKVTRHLYADGTEEVIVRFIVSDRDVRRVRGLVQRELDAKAYGSGKVATSLRAGRRRGLSLEDEDDQMAYAATSKKSTTEKLSIQYGKMKSAIHRESLDRQTGELTGDKWRQKLSSSRGAGFPIYRLPQVAFAAMLESELMSLQSHKASKEFWMLWNPVPKTIPKYYEMIKEPMSLSDIRENIASYKYLNYAAFCYDLDLIVHNAQTFNGPESAIAKKAWDIRKRLCNQLEAKRRILGIEKCPIRNLEESIRKKFIYLGRPVPPPPDRPYAPPPDLPPPKALPPKPIVLPKGFAEFSYAAAANQSPSPPHGSMSPGSPEHTGPAPLASLTVKRQPSVTFGADDEPVSGESGSLITVAGVDTRTESVSGIKESISSASLAGLSATVDISRTASFAPQLAQAQAPGAIAGVIGAAAVPPPQPLNHTVSLPPPMEGGGMLHPAQSMNSLPRSISSNEATEDADLSSASGAYASSSNAASGYGLTPGISANYGRSASQASFLAGADGINSPDATPDAAYIGGASPPGLYLDDGADSSPPRSEGATSPSMSDDDPMTISGGIAHANDLSAVYQNPVVGKEDEEEEEDDEDEQEAADYGEEPDDDDSEGDDWMVDEGEGDV